MSNEAGPDLVPRNSRSYYILRLGIQGIELLRDGTLTLPMADDDVALLRAVRAGERSLDLVLGLADNHERWLTALERDSTLPEHPDAGKIDQLLADCYAAAWAR